MSDAEDDWSDESTDDELDDEFVAACENGQGARGRALTYPQSLPYGAESLEEMDDRLDFIIRRLVDCVRTKDWDVGFVQWNHRLQCWLSLKYPMSKDRRVRLVKLYYELTITPGMDGRFVNMFANQLMTLIASKKRISIKDVVLPWRPLYDILEKELFPKQRETARKNIATTLLSLTEYCQRFFHPAEAPAMLQVILPRMDGSSIDSFIATQSFLVHFLPLSHPQSWLPMTFKMWDAFNSAHYDDQQIDLLGRLAERHLDPSLSDPKSIASLPPPPTSSALPSSTPASSTPQITVGDGSGGAGEWRGLKKDVGIMSKEEFDMVMQKALASFGISVGHHRGGIKVGADAGVSQTIMNLKKPCNRTFSLAQILVYSMMPDALAAPTSAAPSGYATPQPGATPMPFSPAGGTSTPMSRTGSGAGYFLQPHSGGAAHVKQQHLFPGAGIGGAGPQATFVGGSRALDALCKLVLSCETYFHPSNWGQHTMLLTYFLSDVSSLFLERWKDEEKEDCKTPKEWRLTKTIKREFVLALRTVSLLAMFSKDAVSIAATQGCLKNMAMLEPSLIVPAILERAYPSLETLTETHRTTACITALSTLAPALVSRWNYYPGAKHLLPLLELCLPGIDLNDPTKTLSTAMFVITALQNVRIGDTTVEPQADGVVPKTRNPIMDIDGVAPADLIEVQDIELDLPEGREGGDPPLSREEEDKLLRSATAGFGDWVVEFFRRVLALFENLPEEGGKGNKIGGKTEESVIRTLIAACEVICAQLSPQIFDLALKQVYEYATTTTRANGVRVIGQLVSCFARADAKKTLGRFWGFASEGVKVELKHGASSIRTTSTSTPFGSDMALHWNLAILTGAMSNAGPELLRYKAELIDLLKLAVERCKSERGYSWAANLVQRTLQTLTAIYAVHPRFVNSDEWESPQFARDHIYHWGKLYDVKDVKVDWHVPSSDEMDLALQIVREVLVPVLEKVEGLVGVGEDGAPSGMAVDRDEAWTNDFCRYLQTLRLAFGGIATLIQLGPKEGGAKVSDAGDEVPEFITLQPPFKCGWPLEGEQDDRRDFIYAFRDRFGRVLHNAAEELKRVGADTVERGDSIDVVKALLRAIRAHMLETGLDNAHYESTRKAYAFARSMSKIAPKQRLWPRIAWVRRAAFYHATRLHLNTFYKKRNALDDTLLLDVLELSLSPYTAVRKTAQNTLHSLTSFYDGAKSLSLPKIFGALQPGTDVDRMKGALYIVGDKTWINFCILDFRFFRSLVLGLLGAQQQEKPSIQALIQNTAQDVISRMPEIASLTSRVDFPNVQAAADEAESAISARFPPDADLQKRVAQVALGRVQIKDAEYLKLVGDLLNVAEDPKTHWRYLLITARMSKNLIRRDRPISPRIARFFVSQTLSDHPKIRLQAQGSITKILHFIKLRTFAGQGPEAERKLLLREAKNPLRRRVKITDIPGFSTENYLAAFRKPLGDWEGQIYLQDKAQTGWLVWGSELDVYVLPPKDHFPFDWDPSSAEALAVVRQTIGTAEWWSKLAAQYSLESTRNVALGDTINFLKSLVALGDQPFDHLRAAVEPLLADSDRHKQRAASELLSGLLRGSKHWPKPAIDRLWNWFTPRIPTILQNVKPDTAPTWESFLESNLYRRDPRRSLPLVEWVVDQGKAIDAHTTSAFAQAFSVSMVRNVIRALSWRFEAWTSDLEPSYWDLGTLSSDYAEVRVAVAKSIQLLNRTQLHPSLKSIDEFMELCRTRRAMEFLRHRSQEKIEARVESVRLHLEKTRDERLPAPKAPSSTYDKVALTVLRFFWDALHDSARSSVYPHVLHLLPEFFRMRELSDSTDLQNTAKAVLNLLSATPPPHELVDKFVEVCLDLIRSSQSWRIRLHVLPILAVFYFFELPHFSSGAVSAVMEELYDLLRDPNIEVREAAATTLSGIVRCSQRKLIIDLKARFVAIVKAHSKLPRRRLPDGSPNPNYPPALLNLHSGILGVCALINAFPYEVPSWMPELLVDVLAEHATVPDHVISSTIRKCAQDFRRTHQDSWAEDQKKFTEDQLSALGTLFLGESYYA